METPSTVSYIGKGGSASEYNIREESPRLSGGDGIVVPGVADIAGLFIGDIGDVISAVDSTALTPTSTLALTREQTTSG